MTITTIYPTIMNFKNIHKSIKIKPKKNSDIYSYKLFSHNEYFSLCPNTGIITAGTNIPKGDYTLKILRTNKNNGTKLKLAHVIFCRDTDEVDLNNKLIENKDDHSSDESNHNVEEYYEKSLPKKNYSKKSKKRMSILEKLLRSIFQ